MINLLIFTQMRQFLIEVETISSRSNRILRRGDIVNENEFTRANIPSLLQRGFIRDIETLKNDVLKVEKINFDLSPTNLPRFKKRLAIVTGIWQRFEVFEMFANATKKLKHDDVEIVVIVAGSENKDSRQVVEKHGFVYLEVANSPLASKMNASVITAGDLNCDYCLCVGSDDIISQELFDLYIEEINKGTDYVAVLDWYFYDTTTKKLAYWGGYTENWRKGHTCGAGRLLSSRILKQWNWMPWEIKHSHILDNSMQEKLKQIKYSEKIISLKEMGVLAFDIKSSVNMTPFQLWDNTSYIEDKQIENKFKAIICAE